MSLRIIKPGLLDTLQDTGRYGSQHLGVNPSGTMDRYSSRLANALLGKELDRAVIEMHYPAAQLYFDAPTIIAICGADFTPVVNGQPIPLHHAIAVNKNSLLQFKGMKSGSRCYLSVLQEIGGEPWLNSASTNLQAGLGGYNGRSLQRYDELRFEEIPGIERMLGRKEQMILPWTAMDVIEIRNEVQFIIGSEWHWLSRQAQTTFQQHFFQITNYADRMGFQLAGPELELSAREQLVSSAVSFGTIQILPGGQLMILMADHQTTGGYPRIAHIISAHLPLVAQKLPNDYLQFHMTDLTTAEEKNVRQKKYLHEIQIACKFRVEELVYGSF